MGYSDAQLANLYLASISANNILKVRAHRKGLGIEPVCKLSTPRRRVRGCDAVLLLDVRKRHQASGRASADSGAVRSALMPDAQCLMPASDEVRITDKKKVIIIGGGPSRIGKASSLTIAVARRLRRQERLRSRDDQQQPGTVSPHHKRPAVLRALTLEDTLNVIERLNGRRLCPRAIGTRLKRSSISQTVRRSRSMTSRLSTGRQLEESQRTHKVGECFLPSDFESQLRTAARKWA
jgi:hypothetical protein